MAYQTRDPLLDHATQALLQRRGQEALGLLLLAAGLAMGAALVSYVPEDASWMTPSDGPVRNWMGVWGAGLAAPLFMILGWGSIGLPILLAGWGLRLMLHAGAGRALGRLIFFPFAVAALSIHAATLVPGPDWTHAFGLGGLFGDTVLSMALTLVPVGPVLGVKLMSAAIAVLTLGLGLFVLGFTWAEMRSALRFLGVGLAMAAAMLLRGLGGAGRAGLQGARAGLAGAAERRAERQAARAAERERLPEVDDSTSYRVAAAVRAHRAQEADEAGPPEPEPAGGVLARVPRLLRRPEPEPEIGAAPDMAADDRIRVKIEGAIKSRVRRPLTATPGPARAEPPVTSAAPVIPPASAPDLVEEPFYDDEADDLPPPEIVPRPQPAEPVRPKVAKATVRPQPSRQALAEAQPRLAFEASDLVDYEAPPLALLANPEAIPRGQVSNAALEENARMLETVLDDYGVKGEIVSVRPGPVVTMYELEPAPGLKASRVIGLADDIARSMSALSARVSTVPGRSVIGIELPNEKREMVLLREMLAHRAFGDSHQRLPLALGKDIGGEPVIANLAKMPHLLIAGTTGSGKSVAINTMILSLLYKLTPQECRLIMIDPKMLELSVYDGIPHLLSPVVTDPKKAVVALKWTVAEMEDRYRKMSKMGVRNIEGYNGRVREALAAGETFARTVQTGFDDETGDPVFETEEIVPELLPYIVVIVDEMADLMMVAGKEIEACIQRLAQMARASGIHLIMATQRPSVDVITGTIKANFPTRISFQVTSKVDSRTILGEMGAEQLLGMGDMLYMAGGAKISRVHGPFVSDEEVEEIVTHLKQFGPPDYMSGVVDGPDEDRESELDAVLGLSAGGNTSGDDALYDQAVQIVVKDRKCSTSYIQRKLAIGYNKAARLVEQMEDEGVVSAANHVGKREVLAPEP